MPLSKTLIDELVLEHSNPADEDETNDNSPSEAMRKFSESVALLGQQALSKDRAATQALMNRTIEIFKQKQGVL